MKETKKQSYIAGIDGLRAIAVASVLLFHVGISGFDGGFVGVDVFFVISGFLITRLIIDEIERDGKVSFQDFYIRRTRRLFPALFVVLFLSFTFSFLLFTPQHFQRFGGELLYACFSLSNLFFWNESGYFNTDSDFKPLLHTWSLSVEEQFYLIWPALLYLLFMGRRKILGLLALLVIAGGSLIANIVMQDGHSDILSSFSQTIASWFTDGSATIFFLTPFRVFEFAIGASLVWLVRLKFDSNLAREIMMLIGLSMIGWSIANFDQRTIFPSVNALIPCVGAALVIFSCDAKLCGVVVRNKLSVFLGLISYSVYLVHWPIIVFYKYYSVVKISMAEKLLLIVLSLLLGYFLYRFVETPFRLRGNGQHVSKSEFWLACMSLIMLLSLPSATVWANNGWPWRVPPLPSDIAGQIKNSKQFHVDEYGGAGFPYNTGWIGPDKKGVADIVLIGDSHAGQLKTGLSEAIANKHQLSIYYSIAGCLALPEITRIDGGADWDKVCYVALRDALNVLQNSPNATVLIAESWGFEVMKGGRLGSNIPLFDGQNLKLAFQGIRPDLNKLKSLIGERRLVIVGDVPGAGVTDTIGCFSRPKYLYIDCESILTTPRENNLANISNEFLGLYASQNRNVEFINPFDYLCDEKRCRSLVGGKVLYSDGYHLSKAGSRLIVSAFEKKLLGS